jgi:tetratricopeptide (TPR) repeat protein
MRNSPENRIDDLMNRLVKENKLDEAESELAKFNPDNLNKEEKETWFHSYAIEAFRKGDRNEAFLRFQKGIEICPDSPLIAFGLGQEYEFRGDVDRMLECFDKSIFPKIPSSWSMCQASYCYLWNRYDKGIEYIEPFIPVYLSIKVLDDHFLYQRGLHFFGQFWDCLAAFHILKGDLRVMDDLTAQFRKTCTDFDFNLLFMHLDCLKTGDFSSYTIRLKDDIRDFKKWNSPPGVHELELAIIEARMSDNFTIAENILRSVTFQPNDYPWLEDMRILALCELMSRKGDSDTEKRLIRKFLSAQRMLFQPYMALSFNLLDYQEKLKEIYRRARIGRMSPVDLV